MKKPSWAWTPQLTQREIDQTYDMMELFTNDQIEWYVVWMKDLVDKAVDMKFPYRVEKLEGYIKVMISEFNRRTLGYDRPVRVAWSNSKR